jgi:hypothetical protein
VWPLRRLNGGRSLRMVLRTTRSRPMRLSLAAGLLLAGAAAAAANSPRMPAEHRYFAYDAQVAACDSPSVLDRIRHRFDRREAQDWRTDLRIAEIAHVRQTHFRPNGLDLIPRRYCHAKVLVSDGRWRPLWYNIVEDAGMAGWQGSLFLGLVQFPTPGSFNVEWCIDGLDRHRTYAQHCRMARP